MNPKRLKYRILVIGLGSMGKRRIRNLREMGFSHIAGFDNRADRLNEAKELYKIEPVNSVSDAIMNFNPEAFIISVPPDAHYEYMKMAIDAGIHFFVEASVVDVGMDKLIDELKGKEIVAAPSGTLFFHPAIRKLAELVHSNELGDITNFVYHSGQYLPDWHSYEKVSDFYVSNKETGGAREIVPFELTWITKIFGFPNYVSGMVIKGANIEGAETIDDTYNALLGYNDFIVNLVVDVVSRHATRRLLINGTKKQLIWDWNENQIRMYDPLALSWTSWEYEVKSSAEGYNKNITEQMYADELINFFDAIDKVNPFFNNLEYDHRILKLLYAIESSWHSKAVVEFK